MTTNLAIAALRGKNVSVRAEATKTRMDGEMTIVEEFKARCACPDKDCAAELHHGLSECSVAGPEIEWDIARRPDETKSSLETWAIEDYPELNVIAAVCHACAAAHQAKVKR